MDVIHVPRPPRKAINLDRQANALIMAQVSHLQHAERRLPLKYRTEIYTHAIQTEGEAAEYIREVTEGSGIDFLHVSGNSAEKNYPTANGSGVALLDWR